MNTFEDFKKAFNRRYPNTVLLLGKQASIDDKGSPYMTVGIGGRKREGEKYVLLSTLPPSDMALWDFWWESFDKYAKEAKEIHVRKIPEVSSCITTELNSFDYEYPTLVPVHKTQITGRFSFYYE